MVTKVGRALIMEAITGLLTITIVAVTKIGTMPMIATIAATMATAMTTMALMVATRTGRSKAARHISILKIISKTNYRPI